MTFMIPGHKALHADGTSGVQLTVAAAVSKLPALPYLTAGCAAACVTCVTCVRESGRSETKEDGEVYAPTPNTPPPWGDTIPQA